MPRMEVFMQRRLDSLGPEARAAVRAAAVLGGRWDLPLIARCCGSHFTFASVCAAAAELVHEGMWTHAAASAEDAGGAACYTFAHQVLRSLVFAATPEDVRAELHAAVLSQLEERAADAAAGPQRASVWAEWARLSRGANQHLKAAGLFLTAAQVACTSADAGGLSDAARMAHDGIASLRAAERVDHGGDLNLMPARSSSGRLSQHAAAPRQSESQMRFAMRRRNSAPANPHHTRLWRELGAVLDTVHSVQASWAQLEPGLAEHALALTHAFLALCPEVTELVRGKRGLLLSDPAMGPIMVTHQATLLKLVGGCVAGLRDLEALGPTLVATGRMHARFGASIRQFYGPCGAALVDTVRDALGDGFTPEVEAAWRAAYAFVATHMLRGIDQVERAQAAEQQLRDTLLGGQQQPVTAAC
jgi:hypothetical protein